MCDVALVIDESREPCEGSVEEDGIVADAVVEEPEAPSPTSRTPMPFILRT